MTCHMCGYTRGGHDPACPAVNGDLIAWQWGYDAGRNGQPKDPDAKKYDPSYHLGWRQGNCAFEAASNGSQSWDD